MKSLLSDNVAMFTMGAVLIPAMAVLMIGIHVIFTDGTHVVDEINFLEVIGGGGTLVSAISGVIHAWFTSIRGKKAEP